MVPFIVTGTLHIRTNFRLAVEQQSVVVPGSFFIGPSGRGATVRMQAINSIPVLFIDGVPVLHEGLSRGFLVGTVLTAPGFFNFDRFLPNVSSCLFI